MRHSHQYIIGLGLLFSPVVYALDFYADALYWRPSESIDWALTNSNISPSITPNQELSYKTIRFDFAPGFRVGAGLQKDEWDVRLLYTRLNTNADTSVSGNVISTFMPSKFNTKFYQSAHVKFGIDFNMFDLDLSKQVKIDDDLLFNPFIGLRGGWINQEVNTRYQGPMNIPPTSFNPNNVLEHVTNHFSGIGPAVGMGGQWRFYNKSDIQYSLVGNASAYYLWGKWGIYDTLYQNNGEAIGSVNLGNRDFGAFTVQALLGLQGQYHDFSVKVGYEVSDWFNQYQVFDNGSGTHNNDLVLQGLTVALKYSC